MGIKKDLATGSAGEKLVTALFQKHDFIVEKKEGKFSEYDLMVTDSKLKINDFTLEVKYDLYSSKSGNIAIEFHNPVSSKKSGLDITKSDLWVHIVGGVIYITNTETLRAYIAEYHPVRTIPYAGDGNASIYLYSIDNIVPAIFINLEELTTVKFRNVIKKLLGK